TLHAAEGTQCGAKPLSKKRMENIGETHDLSKLLGWVEEAMPYYVKRSWWTLINELVKFEGKSPDWSRYAEVRTPVQRRNGKHRRRRRSFSRRRLVPVEALVSKLEMFLTEAARIDNDTTGDHSALYELEGRGQDLDQKLYDLGLF